MPEEKKKYIIDILDPVLEQMVQALLLEVPPKPIDFMIDWLRRRQGSSASTVPTREKVSLVEMNLKLQKELASMKEFLSDACVAVGEGRKAEADDGASDEEEEEEDDVDDTPMPPPPKCRGPRASVSAEAYGDWNKVKAYKPPEHPKPKETMERLRGILSHSFLFSSLQTKDVDVILLAMVEKSFEAGTRIITQGEDGDHLYVIEEGSPVCKKKIDGEDKVVKTCVPGDVFGELALLYNCPRAATVEATGKCKCWQLDRETFVHIVKDAASKSRQQHDGFLKKVSLFLAMDTYERGQICDALKVEKYHKDELVVKQLEPGDKFYIIEEGSLIAEKAQDGEEPQVVMRYAPGDYFGELALLKNQPRAASVRVTSDNATLLSLDRKSFVKMLGPVEELLKRRQEDYA